MVDSEGGGSGDKLFIFQVFDVFFALDMREQLKSVLSPYQKGGQEVDSKQIKQSL